MLLFDVGTVLFLHRFDAPYLVSAETTKQPPGQIGGADHLHCDGDYRRCADGRSSLPRGGKRIDNY